MARNKGITRLTAVIASLTLLASGCSKSSNRHANMEIGNDPSLPHYNVERLDKDLMTTNPAEVEAGMEQLLEKHGPIFDLYLERIMEVGPARDPEDPKKINSETAQILRKEVLGNPGYQMFYRAEDSVYANGLTKEMEQFGNAMQRFHHFFPQMELPKKVVAMFSCFGPKLAIGPENELMVSLEHYIGEDFKPYNYVDGIYAYDHINMSRKMLVRDMVHSWLMNSFPYEPEANSNGTRLIDEMVQKGKMMYILEACLPSTPEEDLMGYTKAQWSWCEANEKNMWTTIKENKDLYTFNRLTISKYVNPAPHTVFFPFNEADANTPESPGKAGVWIGWRIVESYMSNNAEVTLEQLLAQTDSQKLLEESGYNPK